MAEKGGGKLHDIKETASDAVEIMRELGTPGVQETFTKIREIAEIAKEIMETMKTPEWQANLENIRLVSDNFNQVSERMDRTVKEIKETGVIDDAKDLINTIKSRVDSFGGESGQGGISSSDIKELVTAFREMLDSIRSTADELKLTVAESRKSGTLKVVQETISDASNTARIIREEAERRS